MKNPGRSSATTAITVMLAGLVAVDSPGQMPSGPERYSATVTATDGRSIDVEISVARWTTQAERTAIMAAIEENAAADLQAVLVQATKLGTIVVGESTYELRYAWPSRQRLSRRLFLATDRPIREVTAANDSGFQFSRIDIDTSLTLPPSGTIRGAIELEVDADGTVRVGQLAGQSTPLNDLRLID